MNKLELDYGTLQTPEGRSFIALWRNKLARLAIAVSVLVPVAGIVIALISVAFETKSRGKFYAFPYISLFLSVAFLVVHVYLWSKFVNAL